MVWDIVSKKFNFPPRSEVSDLHWRLLLSYLGVMSAILAIFASGTYLFVSRSFHRQLDRNLLTLAQAATPSHTRIQQEGTDYLDRVDEVPWRDIFNRDSQSLEWFDAQGRLLATRGDLTVDDKPETGSHTRSKDSSPHNIRSYTISVFRDRATSDEPTLEGYIRASQSTEEVQESQQQLLWGLITGGTIGVVLSGMGGVWLTRKALSPLEQNLKQLRQFTADASHELRSPLAVIKSSVQIMQNHPERFHEKDLRKVSAIASATEQMSNLVENLLFLARADANKISKAPSRRKLSLQDILQDLVELFEASAEQEGITLNLEIQQDAKVMGNGEQLYRLFANLLRNALQHTPEGGSVTIRLSASSRSCQISVIDTGVGISAEEKALVFERFWRADRSRSQSQGGTGLGLPIASAIASQHGGKITVTSTLGKGSCFTVRLPTIQTRLSPS
ncbi:HAMP domain-containing histidine kinase [Euhalothece natronophila Z-M001]|uniref:histidine kinase n=1 Tax=Euhalothece natronophila Z-M001 TaxID=522448 RepID=A0A5B8NHS0_9CHRO|nr:HAMP domain-containing sensor histidine kinase [Euhalothece natronophila]QDZ38488.1 HAMP domain-containing histidine kinase [Euhalothece natronophila Z-M001]